VELTDKSDKHQARNSQKFDWGNFN